MIDLVLATITKECSSAQHGWEDALLIAWTKDWNLQDSSTSLRFIVTIIIRRTCLATLLLGILGIA